MLPERRRRSLAAPLAKFAVSEMTSILDRSSLQSVDDRVLELVQSLVPPQTPVDSIAMGTKLILAARSDNYRNNIVIIIIVVSILQFAT